MGEDEMKGKERKGEGRGEKGRRAEKRKES